MPLPTQYAYVTLWNATADYKEWSNPFWFELIGAFSGSFDINAAAISLNTILQPTWVAFMSADGIYLGLDMRVNNNGVSGDASVLTQVAGSGASGNIPNEVAAVVHVQTANPGKTGRGRSYVTGFAASGAAGGRVTTPLGNAISAFFTMLNTAHTIQGQSWQWRMHSPTNVTLSAVSSFKVNSLLGTQRRRRPRR